MKKRQISWEIIVCGLLLTGMAIYLVGNDTREHVQEHESKELAEVNINEAKLSELTEQITKHVKANMPDLSAITIESEKAMEEALKELEASLKELENDEFLQQQQKAIVVQFNKQATNGNWVKASDNNFIYQLSFNADESNELVLDMDAGHISMEGTDAKEATVQFKVQGKRVDISDLESYFNVTHSKNGSTTDIKLEKKNSYSGNKISSLKAIVKLPKTMMINAETNGGHIELSTMNGNNKIQTKGGHITLEDIEGTLTARTNGGHIEGNQLAGTFFFKTNGGHLTFTDLKGTANLETSGGHISVRKGDTALSAETSGGNISVEMLNIPGALNLHTSAGNITLNIPKTTKADLDIEGTRVSVSNALKQHLVGEVDKKSINAYLNSKGTKISAKTSVGFVSVESSN